MLAAAENATQVALQVMFIKEHFIWSFFSFIYIGYSTSGGNGYANGYPASRVLRDSKFYGIGAGTTKRMIKYWP